MLNLFNSNNTNTNANTTTSSQEQVKKLVSDYISRHPCEFLNATKQCCNYDEDIGNLNLKEYWLKLLTLKKSTFLKGWKPTTSQYDTLYDQLFHRYFEHPAETEKYISRISHSFIWIPPNWFEHTEPLPSGRMGQVYLSQCRFPWRTKKLIVREINLCLILNGKLTLDSCPNEIIGITAIRSKQTCCRKLALVSIAAKTTLEQLIPQADQWSFQKLFRTALLLTSAIRDHHKPHPNLQPNNIVLFQDNFTLIDDWPSIPSSSTYGRYPYLHHPKSSSDTYALGIMLWQLASGVIFPQSVPVSPHVYAINPLPYIEPAYQDIIIQCLQKDPPTVSQVCDALVRILMTEMACPSRLHQQHITAIHNRQSLILKYLVAHNASKQDVHNVLYGASITRRMRVHVAISLDPLFHWHPPHKEKKSNPPRRLSISSSEEEEQDYRKKKVHYHDMNTPSSSSSSLDTDLPELMQMGFA